MNLQIVAAHMRENKREHDAEVKRQLCTQMLRAWCSAKLLYIKIPQTKAPVPLKQGALAAEETYPLAAGRLSSGAQLRARRVPPACRIPGCKQSMGEGRVEIGLESLSAHSGVLMLSFSKRLGSPSGLQKPLHIFSPLTWVQDWKRAARLPVLQSESICSQWGKAPSRFSLLF